MANALSYYRLEGKLAFVKHDGGGNRNSSSSQILCKNGVEGGKWMPRGGLTLQACIVMCREVRWSKVAGAVGLRHWQSLGDPVQSKEEKLDGRNSSG